MQLVQACHKLRGYPEADNEYGEYIGFLSRAVEAIHYYPALG